MSTSSQPQLIITPLRKRPAWKALEAHYANIREVHLRQLFAEDPKRAERFTLDAAGLYFDYSKNRITDETSRLLIELAEQSGLRERIDAMFRGEKINVTRPARRRERLLWPRSALRDRVEERPRNGDQCREASSVDPGGGLCPVR